MPDAFAWLKPPYQDPAQQREAATLGMWVFLMTEIMLFGAMFLGYTAYRLNYPEAFTAASHRMNLPAGTINTAVLLTSSLTMVLAGRAARLGKTGATVGLLLVTAGLGTLFDVIKGFEYYEHFQHHEFPGPGFALTAAGYGAELFFWLYFVMTGLHALHLAIGVGLVLVLAVLAGLGKFSPRYHTPVELGGLYWHFVDVVWVFLFPLFYLVGHRP